jgi:L-fucose mutarotase
MLKNISSVISPDLLWLLASMGHGDDLVLVDRNFPAIQVAKQTSTGRLIELPGLNIPQATRAILSLMPLDHFVEEPVTRMRVVDDPDSLNFRRITGALRIRRAQSLQMPPALHIPIGDLEARRSWKGRDCSFRMRVYRTFPPVALEVNPLAFHLDISLVHAPRVTHGPGVRLSTLYTGWSPSESSSVQAVAA